MNFLFIRAAWNDYYDSVPTANHTTNTRLSSEGGQFYVYGVLFQNHSSQIIKIDNSPSTQLLVSDCVFAANQGATEAGGNIYNRYGQCVQDRVCSFDTVTSNSYPHSFFESSFDFHQNYMNESTITGSRGFSAPICHKFGKIIIHNVNISNSYISRIYSVYKIDGESSYDNSLTKNTATVSYSTFIENVCESRSCLYHSQCNTNIHHCNIISNEYSLTIRDSYGVIHLSGTKRVLISDSIIANNKGYSLFYMDRNSNIEVSSCFITSNTYISNSIFTELSPVDSISINNTHISTALCYAAFPISCLINVSTDKQKLVFPEDQSVTGNISLIYHTEEEQSPLKLKVWIDNFNSEEITKDIGSQSYDYSCVIPSEFSIGTHTLHAQLIYGNGLFSNIASVDFEYDIKSTIYVEDLEKILYNTTTDQGVNIKGNVTFKGESISVKCSYDDYRIPFINNKYQNNSPHTFIFQENCSFPDSISDKDYSILKVWGVIDLGESTNIYSKKIYFKQIPVLTLTTQNNRTFTHNKDKNISVTGNISNLYTNDEPDIQIKIDDNPITYFTKNYQSQSEVFPKILSFEINITIPNTLSHGQHNITIEFTYEYNEKYSANQLFYFMNNALFRTFTEGIRCYSHKIYRR